MKRADYSRLAASYDEEHTGFAIDREPVIQKMLGRFGAIKLLDLGCGTGSYLSSQAERYSSTAAIGWYGVDPVAEMIEQARSKAPQARFILGGAEALGFADKCFNLVTMRFVFHHLTDKERALEEVHRIVADGGCFLHINGTPREMQDWWVFRHFPGTRAIAERIYWKTERLMAALQDCGFCGIESRVTRSHRILTHARLLKTARNRGISLLDMLDERDFHHGLERLEDLCRKDPDGRIDEEHVTTSILACNGNEK